MWLSEVNDRSWCRGENGEGVVSRPFSLPGLLFDLLLNSPSEARELVSGLGKF